MIQVCFSWIYVAVFFYAAGDLFELLLRKVFARRKEQPQLPPLFKIPLGIALMILQLSIFHFFLPMSQALHLSMLILLFLYALLRLRDLAGNSQITLASIGREMKNNLPFWLLLIPVGLLLCYVATDYPFYNRDNGRYHFQAVLWAKDYPIVPGLANLHDRLGSNSAWYLVNAFFDQLWLSRKIYHVLNSFIIFYLFVVALYFMLRIKREAGESKILLHAAGIAIFTLLSLSFNFIRIWLFLGVTPDTAVHFFALCYLLFLLFFYEQQWFEKFPLYATAILIVIILTTFSVRMSGIFMLLSILPLVGVLAKPGTLNAGNVLGLSGLAILFVLPVFIRNLLLSGYPFFPSQYFDLFSFDWKLPREIVHLTSDWINNHSIYRFAGDNEIMFNGLIDSRRLTIIWRMFVTELSKKGLLFFNTIAVACLVVHWLFSFLRRQKAEPLLTSFSIIFVVQFILCFVAGPKVRFGFGYIALSIILPSVILLKNPLQRLSRLGYYRWTLALGVFVIILVYLYRPSIPVSVRQVRLKYPLRVATEFLQNMTVFHELVRGKQRVLVVDEKLTVNLSDYDDSHLKLARLHVPNFHYPSCKRIDVFDKITYRTCEEYNAFVATMTWMDPLPSVGAIYRGLSLRGEGLEEGFRIVRPEKKP